MIICFPVSAQIETNVQLDEVRLVLPTDKVLLVIQNFETKEDFIDGINYWPL